VIKTVYHIKYKNPAHNWKQHTLGDFSPGLDEKNRKLIDKFTEGKYQLKKRRYLRLKDKEGFKIPPIRRGRIPIRYPSKTVFDMSVSRDVAEVKKFPWFTRLWKHDRDTNIQIILPTQQILDDIIPNLFKKSVIKEQPQPPEKTPPHSKLSRQRLPRFRSFPYLPKSHYCSFMNDWA
jgi:hypothetical protein